MSGEKLMRYDLRLRQRPSLRVLALFLVWWIRLAPHCS